MTFAQLKRKTLENMYRLEELGKAKKENKYQDMVNDLVEVHIIEIFIIGYFEQTSAQSS